MQPTNDKVEDVTYGSIHHTKDDSECDDRQERQPLFSRKNEIIENVTENRAMIGFGVVTVAVLCSICLIIFSPTGVHKPSSESGSNVPPLSTKSPLLDLGLDGVERVGRASPSSIWGEKAKEEPIPTNRWYLNLVANHAEYPSDETRAYTTPYLIDTAAANKMAGIRVHWPVVQTESRNMQMVCNAGNGLTLGSKDLSNSYQVDQNETLSQLGVSLRWTKDGDDAKDGNFMKTSIVRGMPYATMTYVGGVTPSIFSYNALASDAIVDEDDANFTKVLKCGLLDDGVVSNATTVKVENEVKLHFVNSDFTWLLFFSHPVEIECGISAEFITQAKFLLNVKSTSLPKDPLYVRLALADQCTTGKSDIHQHCQSRMDSKAIEEYVADLRYSSNIFPTSPSVHIEYSTDDKDYYSSSNAKVYFDWEAKSSNKGAKSSNKKSEDIEDLLMFALPHHQKQLLKATPVTNHCMGTFHGKTCLVRGSKWSLLEELGNGQSFTANRPPEAASIPILAESLLSDIEFRIANNTLRGATDTYFSGKILAKVARIILIASELQQLAEGNLKELQDMYTDTNKDTDLKDSILAAQSNNLPSSGQIQNAIDKLKEAVQVWFEASEAPYVYDKSWGGLVNCGCIYVGNGELGHCNNTFPDCPALEDVNLDFGNGFYNDHHFHYGYHVYAAAVVAKFDPKWGKEHYEKILLYLRDYANPSEDDKSFTPFRQKDMWLGSSWASGFVSAENSPHGRDQESSSEAIAAYEAMALFGKVMAHVMEIEGGTDEEKQSAKLVRNTGELLTMTELKAASRYWHVYSSPTHENTYPAGYKELVVGMMYDTMASFQTWFSYLPLVSYGIQLMPFTPVAEMRDDPEWISQMYPVYVDDCNSAGDFCIDNGWSIIQAGICATDGKRDEALEQLLAIPKKVFNSDGGNGQSLSNTIWYIATRKDVTIEAN